MCKSVECLVINISIADGNWAQLEEAEQYDAGVFHEYGGIRGSGWFRHIADDYVKDVVHSDLRDWEPYGLDEPQHLQVGGCGHCYRFEI